MEHVIAVFTDDSLLQIYINTLEMAVLTAIIGTFTAYGAALVTARSHMPKWCKGIIEGIALVTNTIPGYGAWCSIYVCVFRNEFAKHHVDIANL